MNDSERFIRSLEEWDLNGLTQVPKADRHNHYFLGGSPDYIEQATGIRINPLTEKLPSMEAMHQWVGDRIGLLFDGKKRVIALEACFAQAKADGIRVLEIGEDVWANMAVFGGDIRKLIETFRSIHTEMAPETEFRFQIGLSRHCPVEMLEEWIEPFFEQDGFYSVDLYGDELAQPIANFQGIYKRAKERGLVLKAHVGEWGDAESIREAVELLELDEIQHGISATESNDVMKWLAERGTVLNICPTSNLMLGRVDRMEDHPIRRLYDHGIKVTVNTDDYLVFGQSVSQEFLNLYRAKLFSAVELDEIRLNGLS